MNTIKITAQSSGDLKKTSISEESEPSDFIEEAENAIRFHHVSLIPPENAIDEEKKAVEEFIGPLCDLLAGFEQYLTEQNGNLKEKDIAIFDHKKKKIEEDWVEV